MKYMFIVVAAVLLSGCFLDDDNEYTTCSITESYALYWEDRDYDLSQCWYIEPTQYSNFALDQCEAIVNSYMRREYGHSSHEVIFTVSSGSCPYY